jgi:chromosomal replication initiation ATPase DnaA
MYFIQGFADDPNDSDYKHTVFCGPPGTGKTEMAKLLGTMYAKLGVLKNNVFKKATRVDLVAGYLGQTAIKTQKLIDDCSGGVLFIDEAYSLQYDDSYAKECVDTLCEALSDRKHNLMVILAGYEADLENHIFRINPGLKSRFIWKFDIPPYSVGELFQILCNLCDKRGWSIEPNVNETWLEMKKNHFPDNGRSMEKLFSCSKIAHASRIYGKESSWRKKLSIDDLNKGFEMFQEYGNSKKENIYLGLYT